MPYQNIHVYAASFLYYLDPIRDTLELLNPTIPLSKHDGLNIELREIRENGLIWDKIAAFVEWNKEHPSWLSSTSFADGNTNIAQYIVHYHESRVCRSMLSLNVGNLGDATACFIEPDLYTDGY
jgi:hypothetical protein